MVIYMSETVYAEQCTYASKLSAHLGSFNREQKKLDRVCDTLFGLTYEEAWHTCRNRTNGITEIDMIAANRTADRFNGPIPISDKVIIDFYKTEKRDLEASLKEVMKDE